MLRTVYDGGEVAGVQSEGGSLAGGERGRQSRLADDRGQHGRLDGHRQRKAAGETHADRADAGTAALGVRLGGKRASQLATGLVRSARMLNSRATQMRRIDRTTAPVVGASPGRPNSEGR